MKVKKTFVKLLLAALLLIVPFGLPAQGSPAGDTYADYYRNSIKINRLSDPGYFGSGSDTILENIAEKVFTRSDATSGEMQIYQNLKNKITDVTAMVGKDPSFFLVVICNDTYGILFGCWNDTQSFGQFQDTGLRIMTGTYFFRLK